MMIFMLDLMLFFARVSVCSSFAALCVWMSLYDENVFFVDEKKG